MSPSELVAIVVRVAYKEEYGGRREVAEARFTTCATCPELGKIGVCSKCGCYMPGKVWLLGASCPLQKWGPEGTVHAA